MNIKYIFPISIFAVFIMTGCQTDGAGVPTDLSMAFPTPSHTLEIDPPIPVSSQIATEPAAETEIGPMQIGRVKFTGAMQRGLASYYTCCSRTASGAPFRPDGISAAHRTLPFGTIVMVTNLTNHRQMMVPINDRGPFVRNRIIDLSRGAARGLGMIGNGMAPVMIQVVSNDGKKSDQNN